MNKKKTVVCIGGGHGLGNLLKTFSTVDKIDLTGVVTTTDNGGSTGRLRENSNSIAWGDIRYCLSKLSEKSSIQSVLLEHRFEQLGELSGHCLGNLMFCAIDNLCLKPTDSVKVMAKFLDINVKILPMSDEATQLVSEAADKSLFIGETSVDRNIQQDIVGLTLKPMVKPTDSVTKVMKEAEVLFLGPGSFFTSTLPSLLMPEVITVINNNVGLKVYMLLNVENEFNNGCDNIDFQLSFLQNIGLEKEIKLVIPNHRKEEVQGIAANCLYVDLPPDKHGRHDSDALKEFLQQNICQK
jgi:uncharacterized cofD-like protein